jgi:hypothetical protein
LARLPERQLGLALCSINPGCAEQSVGQQRKNREAIAEVGRCFAPEPDCFRTDPLLRAGKVASHGERGRWPKDFEGGGHHGLSPIRGLDPELGLCSARRTVLKSLKRCRTFLLLRRQIPRKGEPLTL